MAVCLYRNAFIWLVLKGYDMETPAGVSQRAFFIFYGINAAVIPGVSLG